MAGVDSNRVDACRLVRQVVRLQLLHHQHHTAGSLAVAQRVRHDPAADLTPPPGPRHDLELVVTGTATRSGLHEPPQLLGGQADVELEERAAHHLVGADSPQVGGALVPDLDTSGPVQHRGADLDVARDGEQ